MRAVIFDIGGVLEITPETGWQGTWARRLGISAAALEARLGPIWAPGATGEATLDEIERRTSVALSLDATQLTALMTDAWDEYLGTLNAEMASYFAGLRGRSARGRDDRGAVCRFRPDDRRADAAAGRRRGLTCAPGASRQVKLPRPG